MVTESEAFLYAFFSYQTGCRFGGIEDRIIRRVVYDILRPRNLLKGVTA